MTVDKAIQIYKNLLQYGATDYTMDEVANAVSLLNYFKRRCNLTTRLLSVTQATILWEDCNKRKTYIGCFTAYRYA